MTEPFRIAVAGLGTVGAGVVKIVQQNAELIAARAGRPIEITAVSARNRTLDRGVDLSAYAWDDDAAAMAARNDVDCVVEVIGGSDGPAKAALERALGAGRHAVTANKALIAHHGHALATLADENGGALRFEAAVAGGIPVLKALGEGLAANRVTRLYGVLNGTCNYILTEMEKTHRSYDDVLNEAQKLGYAEADPSFDVGGVDAAHKLSILASLAFGTQVDFDSVATEGIERIELKDIEFAADLGYRIKLLGVAVIDGKGVEQRVQPCMVPAGSTIGALDGVTNAVVCEGDFVGKTVFEGPGAGEGPTASAIVADVIDVARGAKTPAFGVPASALTRAAPQTEGAHPAEYYLRFLLKDTPGALAKVTAALGDEGVSIDRMRQYAHEDNGAPVLVVTHDAGRGAIDRALETVAGLDVSLAAPVAIRIEKT